MTASVLNCTGQVFALAFRDGIAARIADKDWAGAPPHDWVWLHLGLSDHRARRFLEGLEGLSAEARALLLGSEDRIQLHLAGAGAFGVLPDIAQDFAEEAMDPGRLIFWLDDHSLITVRRHPLRAVEDVRAAAEAGLRLSDPAAALAALQERYAAIIEARLAVVARELGRLEDAVLSDREGLDHLPLGPLRREVARHARECAALRSALGRALSGRQGEKGGDSLLAAFLPPMLQDAEDFGRDAAALTERARLLYEEVDARIAARANRALSGLTIMSTLLLPPTFVVGAFGMNVEGLPWSHDGQGFAVVIGFCVLLVAISYGLLRRFRILP
jgi:zinc transporter